jgi:hypothetical protein
MVSTTATLRKDLSAPGLIAILRKQFSKIEDCRHQASIRFSLPDTLCAALAMFQFKFPSLLQFDEACQADEVLIGNLLRLYSLDEVASDTQMRSILDEVRPSELRPAFRALHSSAQRGKVLEDFAIFDNQLLLSIDGTGLFNQDQLPTLWRKEAPFWRDVLLPPVTSDGDRTSGSEKRAATGL